MFQKLRETIQSFGYQEYDGPMLESFDLYAAKTGEEIVEQQLYWFLDKANRKMAIRPEMTPTLARMVSGKIHETPQPIRWYSVPNLWRYERPQRGRLREHWQLNVDVLGGDPLMADAEVLMVALEIMNSFGGQDKAVIRINHRKLVDFFFSEHLKLNSEISLRVTKLIDAKNKVSEEVFQKSLAELGLDQDKVNKLDQFFNASFEQIQKDFDCPGARELAELLDYLKQSGAEKQVVFDSSILRGLDYYTGTVFEVYDCSPENNRAMFGGGRYDNLVGLFGKNKLSGVGFGMGDVTLRNFLETHQLMPSEEPSVDVFVSLPHLDLREKAENLAKSLRSKSFKVMTPLEVGGFKNQLKLANKHGVRFVVLFGEDELKKGQLLVKELQTGNQEAVNEDQLVDYVTKKIRGV